ncbi:MAG: hypothetical protein RL639_1899 [Verrucomicrobiota bacterium]|jgi:hypothetical protein
MSKQASSESSSARRIPVGGHDGTTRRLAFLARLSCLLFFLTGTAFAADNAPAVYPTPAGYEVDARLGLTVNGKPVPVLKWTTIHKKKSTEYLYARFSVAGEAVVKITSEKPITSQQVRPAAFGLKPEVSGQTMTFTLPGSRYCIVTINGIMLMILADPPETNAPRPGDAGIHVLPKTADPTGERNCTEALQATIDAAAADQKGGGVAYVPRGTYKVGPFRLKSDVTLYLEEGAVLRFDEATAGATKDFAKVVHKDNERSHPGIYFIKADEAQNIRVAGRGIIDVNAGEYYKADGWLISCMRIQNVRNFAVDGVTIRENSSWSILTAGCEGVRFENVKVLNGMGFEQNDAFDIISCQDVLIRHCFGHASDDIYCLKAGGKGVHGGGITTSQAKAFGKITVQDCVAYTRTTGFKMGQQSTVSGEDFTCRQLYVIAARNGVTFALFDGPAVFKNIRVEHVYLDEKNTVPLQTIIKKGGQVKDLSVSDVFCEMQPVTVRLPKEK